MVAAPGIPRSGLICFTPGSNIRPRRGPASGGWVPSLVVTFKPKLGREVKIHSNYEVWSEGTGDWPATPAMKDYIARLFGLPLEDFTAATKPGSIEGMRVAVPDSKQLPDFMHPDVVQAWQKSARTFGRGGRRGVQRRRRRGRFCRPGGTGGSRRRRLPDRLLGRRRPRRHRHRPACADLRRPGRLAEPAARRQPPASARAT